MKRNVSQLIAKLLAVPAEELQGIFASKDAASEADSKDSLGKACPTNSQVRFSSQLA
jgi:hypothetical protein